MKVLHFETGRHLYGGAIQVAYLIEGLAFEGIQSVFLGDARSPLAETARRAGASVYTHEGGEADPRWLGKLRQIMRTEKPDWLHVHSRRGADTWGPLAARLTGVPLIVTRRVDNVEVGWLARWRYRPAQAVVSISRAIEGVLAEAGVPATKRHLIPSAVDTRIYAPDHRADAYAALRQLFAWPEDALVIGMVAQFIRRKGHHRLLKILPSIFARFPTARVVCFGQGPEWEAVRTCVKAEGWEARVQLPGFRDDLAKLLPGLDVLVHPADQEGLGVALLQAGACGVPVVAGAAGGIPEVIVDGETGFLHSPEDLELFEARVTQLLGEADLRAQFGQAARQRIEAHFSVIGMARAYARLYHAQPA